MLYQIDEKKFIDNMRSTLHYLVGRNFIDDIKNELATYWVSMNQFDKRYSIDYTKKPHGHSLVIDHMIIYLKEREDSFKKLNTSYGYLLNLQSINNYLNFKPGLWVRTPINKTNLYNHYYLKLKKAKEFKQLCSRDRIYTLDEEHQVYSWKPAAPGNHLELKLSKDADDITTYSKPRIEWL